MRRSSTRFLVVAAAAVFAAGLAAWAMPGEREAKERPLGLFSSLPIYWSESGSITEALDGAGDVHWARTALEERYALVPLDTLDGDELGGLERILMAQPRPLAPAENVALDKWVREGGRLLLFADPLLTDHSRFGLGDKRRPQDVVLISPILRRWGLALTFDEAQADGERTIAFGGKRIPLHLPGALARVEASAPADCAIRAAAVIAECRIGEGQVVVISDAALLESERGASEGAGPLSALLTRAFAD